MDKGLVGLLRCDNLRLTVMSACLSSKWITGKIMRVPNKADVTAAVWCGLVVDG